MHHRRELRQRLPGPVHAIGQEQAGEDPVAGGGEIAEDHMTRLLAAQHEIAGLHRGEHVAVTDGRLHHRDPRGIESLAQTEVRHHRDRDRVVAQQAAFVHVERGDHHDLVAVDDLAAFVDREHPIGVAVEREADVGSRRDHCGLQIVGCGRAARFVDVRAVGRRVQHGHLGTQSPEHRRAELVRGTVGAIDHDAHAVERAPVDGRNEMGEVPVGRLFLDERRVGRNRLAGTGAQLVLDALLGRVVELATAGSKQLDPVVGPRVVARRDHQRGPARARREKRETGRRHDPRVAYGRATGMETGREVVAQARSRAARVATDEERQLGTEHRRRGTSERDDEIRGEVGVRVAADAVGTEAEHGLPRAAAAR